MQTPVCLFAGDSSGILLDVSLQFHEASTPFGIYGTPFKAQRFEKTNSLRSEVGGLVFSHQLVLRTLVVYPNAERRIQREQLWYQAVAVVLLEVFQLFKSAVKKSWP